MNITGTSINYYFHCKKQCWLSQNFINMEFNSELVKVGSELHKNKLQEKKSNEVWIDNIRIDQLTDTYAVEVKKTDSDVESAKWQLMYYLYVLKQNGILRKGKIEILEPMLHEKTNYYIELTAENEEKLLNILTEIKVLSVGDVPESPAIDSCSSKCSYYDYCQI